MMIHLSAAEAARDLADVLARVRAGDEVIIDDDASAPVLLLLAPGPSSRARIAPASEPDPKRLGVLDSPGFALPQDFFDPLPESELRLWEGTPD